MQTNNLKIYKSTKKNGVMVFPHVAECISHPLENKNMVDRYC